MNWLDLIQQLFSTDQIKSYQARMKLQFAVGQAGLPEQSSVRSALADAIAASLFPKDLAKGKHGAPTLESVAILLGRNEIARQLGSVARPEDVSVLRQGLDDVEIRESIRFALDRSDLPECIDLLAEAATKGTAVEFRVGAINSLGRKGDSRAVGPLQECLSDPSPEVRLAAAEALANHPDPSSDAMIVQTMKLDSYPGSRSTQRLTRARLRLASTLVKSGNVDDARQIWASILAGQPTPAQKKAAELGLQSVA